MNHTKGEMSAERIAQTQEPLGAFRASSNPSPTSSLPALIARNLVANFMSTPQSDLDESAQTPSSELVLSSSSSSSISSSLETHTLADRWNEYWSRQPFPSGYTQSSVTLLACFISTIIFLIVVGNLLVCIAIFTEKSLKPTQNWFIASLAVSDLLLGLVVMPFSLARELMGFWIFGPLWCDIHEAIDVLLTTASINTLCLISLDRYWSITQAVSYLKKRTPKRGAFMIAFVWFFSAAVSLPPLFGWRKQMPATRVPSSNATIPATLQPTTTTTLPSKHPNKPDNSNIMQPDRRQEQPAGQQRNRQRRRHSQLDQLAKPMLTSRHLRSLLHQPSASLYSHQESRDQDLVFAEEAAELEQPEQAFISTPPMSASSSITTSSPIGDLGAAEYPTCSLSDDVGYVLYSALGSFYIPCAVMVFTYIKIFLAARSRARRAINKQSRNQLSSGKRLASRRDNPNQTSISPALASSNLIEGNANQLVGSQSHHLMEANNGGGGKLEPMMKGKIVIVESRKKSLPASAIAPMLIKEQVQLAKVESETVASSASVQFCANTNTATYSCSELSKRPSSEQELTPFALTTSGAKQASSSVLSSDLAEDSSVVTVMSSSMIEVPVTRFKFQQPAEQSSSSNDKAASLLEAISQVGDQDNSELLSEVLSSSESVHHRQSNVPDIIVERRSTVATLTGSRLGLLSGETGDNTASILQDDAQVSCAHNTTNETCFMTIEEDSDILDAQAGRSIMMIAANASNKQTNNLGKSQAGGGAANLVMMTMMPSGDRASGDNNLTRGNQQAVMCSNMNCRRRAELGVARSNSSYCGSSITINDDDIDDCMDDEQLTDDCNGFSVSCPLDQYCPSSSDCPHCQKCVQHEQQQQQQQKMSPLDRHLSISESAPNKDHDFRHQQAHQQQHQQQHEQQSSRRAEEQQQKQLAKCVTMNSSEAEAQSITGDDNLSFAEYRSNEDSSSIVGHDVLDATEHHHRPKSSNDGASGRKKSSIGLRLARLGSSAPLTSQSGGLLDLASSQQQQSSGFSGTTSGGTRNLKALRQNFFLKLNQLTTKSITKNEKRKKSTQMSPNGKSSTYFNSLTAVSLSLLAC